jgi:hypothetical protein
MAHRRLLGEWRIWRSLLVAAAAVVVVTWPFVTPYLELRKGLDVGVRAQEEVVSFSADVYSFATASSRSRLWGDRMAALPKGEGEGFPGLTILAFALIGIGVGLRGAGGKARFRSDHRWQRMAPAVFAVALTFAVLALVVLTIRGSRGRPWHDVDPVLIAIAVLIALGIRLVPGVRRFLGGTGGSVVGFYAVAMIASALLALGPRIHVAGQVIGTGPYAWLFDYVPGFDGLRVPARFLMLTALFAAVLAGLGAAAVLAWRRRAGLVLVAAASVVLLAEAWVVPMPTNVPLAVEGLEPTPTHPSTGEAGSPLYALVRDAPGQVVLIEFPFGETAYETLATFHAGYHRRPLVNGYSGFFPLGYLRRATFLRDIPPDLQAASQALRSSGATLALVHEDAFPEGRGREISDWLLSTGAAFRASAGHDKLFELK